jgi:hypothetical protein
MDRVSRLADNGLDGMLCDDGEPHRWQPVSLNFEMQAPGRNGRLRPDIRVGCVYVVCMECRCHAYVSTEWAGFQLGGPPSLPQ